MAENYEEPFNAGLTEIPTVFDDSIHDPGLKTLKDALFSLDESDPCNVLMFLCLGKMRSGKTVFLLALCQMLIVHYSIDNVELRIFDNDSRIDELYKFASKGVGEILKEIENLLRTTQKSVVILCLSDIGRLFGSTLHAPKQQKADVENFIIDVLTKIAHIANKAVRVIYLLVGSQSFKLIAPRIREFFDVVFLKSSTHFSFEDDIKALRLRGNRINLLNILSNLVLTKKQKQWILASYAHTVKLFQMRPPNILIDLKKEKSPIPEEILEEDDEEETGIQLTEESQKMFEALLKTNCETRATKNLMNFYGNQATVYYQRALRILLEEIKPYIKNRESGKTGENRQD